MFEDLEELLKTVRDSERKKTLIEAYDAAKAAGATTEVLIALLDLVKPKEVKK